MGGVDSRVGSPQNCGARFSTKALTPSVPAGLSLDFGDGGAFEVELVGETGARRRIQQALDARVGRARAGSEGAGEFGGVGVHGAVRDEATEDAEAVCLLAGEDAVGEKNLPGPRGADDPGSVHDIPPSVV